MLFNSLEFLSFFVIVYSLYAVLSHRAQNRWLLAASLFFYGFWDWRFLFLLVGSTSIDFVCSHKIRQASTQEKKRFFLVVSVVSNLTILGFFKYFNFFADNLVGLAHSLGISCPSITWKVLLPIGVSFYTFQAIGYIIDVYRGEVEPIQDFLDYGLFVSFFPQLIAGPIQRAKHLMPQILKPRTITAAGWHEGCWLFFWGLFEKIFIASNLARVADQVFSSPAPYKGADVVIALYAFAFQIFCDFDAYSCMARGLGKVMGFEITWNFNLPYSAANPREFWQRWHISLSTWLRDYLYIPLGGNRSGRWGVYRNLGLTMLLGGLWHGASWTFVLWGAYQGALLMIHRFACELRSTFRGRLFCLPHWIDRVIFFQWVLIGWLLFRASSMGQVGEMLRAIFMRMDWSMGHTSQAFRVFFLVLPLLAVQFWQEKTGDLMVVWKQHWLLKTIIYAFMAYLILGFGIMKPEQFIYFQF